MVVCIYPLPNILSTSSIDILVLHRRKQQQHCHSLNPERLHSRKKRLILFLVFFSCISFVFAYGYNEQDELGETFCEDHFILKDARTCTKETASAGVKEVPSSSSWKRKGKAGMFYTLCLKILC